MIELRDIVFAYPRAPHHALDGASLTLHAGERLGLVGPNGAGKSTLLRLIVGLLRPHSGEVRIFGETRREEKDFLEVRRRIGLLFQESDDQLFCPTVEEDVAFGPLNLGKTRTEAREIVARNLAAVRLEGFEKRLTHELSGGEKRRVALASVLAMNPEALLLDEPVAGLDEESAGQFIELLGRTPCGYIVISHDRGLLSRVANRVAVLKDGKIRTENS